MPEAMSVITLSPVSKDVVATEPCVYADALGEPIVGLVEPVGARFESIFHKRSSTPHGQESLSEPQSQSSSRVPSEDEAEYKSNKLDPKHWKELDHYAIMGLSKLRYKATDEDIRKAYRRKVLKHHPDKKGLESMQDPKNDDYFKCLQRSYELLSDPIKRRQYDSVDAAFNESLPTGKEKGDFYAVFRPVFESNGRFSRTPNVPDLGDDQSPFDKVEHFYDFWSNFDSWRTFEFLDEEVADSNESRDERRYVEKKNKAARAKLKKEDNQRLIRLVESAMAADPRIKRHKAQLKADKEAQKKAKEDEQKRRADEAARLEAERRMALEREEQERKRKLDENRMEAAKRAQELKALQEELKAIVKKNNYFAGPNLKGQDVLNQDGKLYKICTSVSREELEKLVQDMNEAKGFEELQALYEANLKRFKLASNAGAYSTAIQAEAVRSLTPEPVATPGAGKVWDDVEIEHLVHAVKTISVGTIQRWEKIATYVSNHSNKPARATKEVIEQAKKLQSDTGKTSFNQGLIKSHKLEKEVGDGPSIRYELETTAGDTTTASQDQDELEKATQESTWSATEMKLLQEGLRRFPASGTDRWDRIAEMISTKSKKEIILRFKEISEQVKAKRVQASG